ncbi:MAG: pilin [Patescibacteria group bacterium]
MKKLLALALLLPSMLVANQALAVDVTNFGTQNLNNLLVYSTKNVYETVSNIINIILSFLGALAILLFLYAGFKWLTSQGNTDKIDEAKKLMGAAVIGIAIIFAAYALSTFIIGSLFNNTVATTP